MLIIWHFCAQRGYLSSRDTLLDSIFGEANNDNAGATLVWDWIAWPTDDPGYSFDVWSDGSNAMHAQISYMNGKVPNPAPPLTQLSDVVLLMLTTCSDATPMQASGSGL